MRKSVKSLLFAAFALLSVSTIAACGTGAKDKFEQWACEHNYGDTPSEIVRAATCDVEGEALFVCTKCSKTEMRKVKKLGHESIESNDGLAATCSTSGRTASSFCGRCGEVLEEGREIPALGHEAIDGDDGIPAGCTTTGKTASKICKHCGMIMEESKEIAALGHKLVGVKAVPATCTTSGSTGGILCGRCDDVSFISSDSLPREIPALGHMNAEKVELVVATCSQEGNIEYYSCPDCGENVSEKTVTADVLSVEDIVVLPMGHVRAQLVEEVPATCTVDGTKEHYYCSVCEGRYENRAASAKRLTDEELSIPAIGEHSYDDDYVCTVCGYTDYTEGLAYVLSDDGLSFSVVGVGTATDTNLKIPSEYDGKPVTRIEANTFEFSVCGILFTDILIPEGIKEIGDYAFGGQSLVVELIIPESVIQFGHFVCQYMSNLKTVYFKGACTLLESPIFNYCDSLETVIFYNPLTLGSGLDLAGDSLKNLVFLSNDGLMNFTACPIGTSLNIYCPSSLLYLYKTHERWQEYANQFVAVEGTDFDLRESTETAAVVAMAYILDEELLTIEPTVYADEVGYATSELVQDDWLEGTSNDDEGIWTPQY